MHLDNSDGLKVVRYTKDFYEEIRQFYLGHGWDNAPVEKCLPDIGFVVVNDAGVKLAVGFLYVTNSIMYVMEWTATNPASPLRQRAKAFTLLIKTIQGLVKKQKPDGQIIQFTPNESIVRLYKKLGFVVTEQAVLLHWNAAGGDK